MKEKSKQTLGSLRKLQKELSSSNFYLNFSYSFSGTKQKRERERERAEKKESGKMGYLEVKPFCIPESEQ